MWFDDEEKYAAWVRRVELCTGDGGPLRFACGQLERCPNTGRLHGQVFVQWRQQQRGTRLGTATRLISRDFHWELRRGSVAEARAYCTKEETRVSGPFEFGDPSGGQGTRTDLSTATGLISGGASLKRVAEECPTVYAKFHKGLAALRSVLQDRQPGYAEKDVRLYYGPTGLGKTRRAYTEYPRLCRLPVPTRGATWFDGYDGQEVVLMDDYGGDCVYPFQFCLQMLDGYPMQVPTKGGFVTWAPEVIIITSNVSVDLWYPSISAELVLALKRRITTIVRFIDEVTSVVEKEVAANKD